MNIKSIQKLIAEEFEDLLETLTVDVRTSGIRILDKSTGISVSTGKKDLLSKLPVSGNYYFDSDKCDFEARNPGMVHVHRTGFFKDNVFEGFIDRNYIDSLEDFKLARFKIGKIKVEIGEASALFKVLFHYRTSDKWFDGWEGTPIIKLSGVTKNNYEDYLGMALFYLHKYNPSPYDGVYPEVTAVLDSYEMFSDAGDRRLPKGNEFRKFKYPEVLRFYNKAVILGKDEVAYLYYYKVLEYFFNISRKDELVKIVGKYGVDKNTDALLQETSRFYSKSEIACLQFVLSMLKKNYLHRVLTAALAQGLLKTTDISEVADLIYSYRNSIAHGKKEARLDLYLPTIQETKAFSNVLSLIQRLSWGCIRKYCL